MKEKYLYIETTSDEAVDLIEDRVLVASARRLLEGSSLNTEESRNINQALREMERELAHKIRRTVLQPDPVRVSRHLFKRIKQEIKKENKDEL